MLTFDVDAMSNYHNYAVMACAMSKSIHGFRLGFSIRLSTHNNSFLLVTRKSRELSSVAANLAAEDTKVVTERLAKRLAEFEMSTKAELGTLRQKLQAFFEHRYKYDVRNNWEAVIAPREDGSGNVSSIAFPRTIIWTDYMLLVDRPPDKFTHLPMSARAFGSCRVSLPKAFRTRFSRKSTFCTM